MDKDRRWLEGLAESTKRRCPGDGLDYSQRQSERIQSIDKEAEVDAAFFRQDAVLVDVLRSSRKAEIVQNCYI